MKRLLYKLLIICALIAKIGPANAQNFLSATKVDLKMAEQFAAISNPSKLVFSKTIFEISTMQRGSQMMVKLRNQKDGVYENKGHIVFFDPSTKRELWTKKVNYNKDEADFFDSITIKNSGNYCQRLSLSTGKEMWKRDGNALLFYPANHSIISTFQPTGDFQTLKIRSYNAETGQNIWEAKYHSKEGFKRTYQFDSLHIVTIGSGVRMTHLETGETWSHALSSTETDYSNVAGRVAGAVAMGLLTGVVMIGPMTDKVHDIQSNLALADPYIFMAGKEELVKLNKKDGFIAWSHPLNAAEMSSSRIFLVKDRLYLLNLGYAKMNGHPQKIGIPFLAAFDIESGIEIFKKNLPDNPTKIRDFAFDSTSHIYLLYPNELRKLNLQDGSEERKMSFQLTKGLFPLEFESRKLYHKSDSAGFYPMFEMEERPIFIRMNNGHIWKTNQLLDTIIGVNKKDFYLLYASVKSKNQTGIKVFKSEKQAVVTDFSNKMLVEFENARQFRVWQNHLWVTSNNWLYSFDISSLISTSKDLEAE